MAKKILMRNHEKIKSSYRFSPESDFWLEKEALKRGLSKNAIVQELINKEMEKKPGG